MFDDETSTQPIADRLKYIIHRAQPAKGKRAAMTVLQQFERCGWHSRAFDEAAAGQLAIEEGKLIYVGGDPVAGIADILTRYLELAGCKEEELPDPMTTEQAARYLGITVDGVKKQVHRTGKLAPTLEGHTLMFSKAMLDEYKQSRKIGRPSNQVKE